jgi:hypothetical protein
MAATVIPPSIQPSTATAVFDKADGDVSSLRLLESATDELVTQPGSFPYLIASPYLEQEHLLDLRTLDAENALLARALTHLRPLRSDYATAAYQDTFDWPEIIEKVRKSAALAGHKWKETSFFVVAFRSRIPPTTVYAELGKLDKAAHAEATASGGFLKYVCNEDGRQELTGP